MEDIIKAAENGLDVLKSDESNLYIRGYIEGTLSSILFLAKLHMANSAASSEN
jgi:hypothetical protein